VRTMRYSKHGEGWGRGDALWACDTRYGNCTDFHSLLIGMARSQGIPARFVIGFPIPADKEEAEIAGYHCWAEVYDRDRGWLPLDASEAWKSKRFDDYFGKIPSDRVEFTVGRDLTLTPPQRGDPLNFFIYPYVEANGKPVNEVAWTLHVRRLSAARSDR
jgi:transglutaminase-like putative cysteine protease